MSDSRPRRQAAGRSRARVTAHQKQPEAQHYIGYVEDGESVEMIMKKFQVLEEMKQAQRVEREQQQHQQQQESDGASEEDSSDRASKKRPHTEEIEPADDSNEGLLSNPVFAAEFFKNTSTFTVGMASRDNADDTSAWELLQQDNFELQADDLAEFFSDYEDWDSDSFWKKENRKHKRRKSGTSGGSGISRASLTSAARAKQQLLTYEVLAGGYVVPVRRRRIIDPTVPVTVRIPNPVPYTWARIIAPLGAQPLCVPFNAGHHMAAEPSTDPSASASAAVVRDPAAVEGVAEVADILQHDWPKFVNTRCPALQGLLLDPPWRMPVYGPDGQPTGDFQGSVTGADLAKIPFSQILRPHGFVFCWVEKPCVPECVEALEEHGFYYVENLCCVQLSASNQPACTPSPFFRTSKRTLLMFRRKDTPRDGSIYVPGRAEASASLDDDIRRPLELRHQRNPDVCFDFSRKSGATSRTEKPHYEYLYYLIETLLPNARPSYGSKANALNDAGTCKLLELWHSRKEVDGKPKKRPGWFHIAEATG